MGELLASVAGVFEKREELLIERMSLLERRLEELEQKLDRYEAGLQAEVEVVAPEAEDAVEEEQLPVEDAVSDEAMLSVEEQADEPAVVESVEEMPAPQQEIEIEFEFDEEDMEVVEQAGDVEEVNGIEEIGGVGEEQEPAIVSVMEKARPDWYDWEVDIPGPYLDDIWDGIGLNDRMLFLNELFCGNDDDFRETLAALNGMGNLVEAAAYVRERFPEWNEESDEVYRFYMTVRRRFVKRKQEDL